MLSLTQWFERKFQSRLSRDEFPVILERLRGTPVRVVDKVKGMSIEVSTRRLEDGWSIQEQVGHLLDLEPLWDGRLDDLLEGKEELRPADLTNRKTHDARHNDGPIDELIESFRNRRGAMVRRLEELDEEAVERTALHPRLKQPMSLIDLLFFVAEHDDHHLARITELQRALADSSPE